MMPDIWYIVGIYTTYEGVLFEVFIFQFPSSRRC